MINFNWPIIGHKDIQKFLQTSIINNKLSHAYLFHGQSGAGKANLAQYFAMSILCLNNSIPSQTSHVIPCEKCIHCQQIKKKIHPDVFWYERSADKKEISIEQIRKIINKLSTTSFLGSYKIGIILGADTMSLAAANSLLKTLEEPSKKTILILTSQNLFNIPKTVLSRCLIIKFLPVAYENIYQNLLDQKIERTQADIYARISLGFPERALDFSRSKTSWPNFKKNCQNLIQLIDAPIKDKINFTNQLLSSKNNLEENRNILIDVLKNWQCVLRDLILLKHKKNDKIINTWAINELSNISQNKELNNFIISLSKIDQSLRLTRQNVNPKMILENFLLNT